MRPCTEYEALISAFIDGALLEEERVDLMDHLAFCPACEAYFNDQIAIHAALHPMEGSEAPAALTDGVMAEIRSERKPQKKVIQFPRWRQFAALAACCAIVVSLAALQGPWRRDGTQPKTRTAEDAAVAQVQPAQAEPEAAIPQMYTGAHDAENAPCAGAVSAGGPAARAWVAENLDRPWTPGERYELTAEQYGALLAALKEAGEQYATPSPAVDSQGFWLFMEE